MDNIIDIIMEESETAQNFHDSELHFRIQEPISDEDHVMYWDGLEESALDEKSNKILLEEGNIGRVNIDENND